MGKFKPLSSIVNGLRERGWTPRQILDRTGVPVKTQADIRAGRTSGATYEASLRKSNRYDRGAPPARIRRLQEAEDIVELKRIKRDPRLAKDSRSFSSSLNYRRDKAKAQEAARRRKEKFSVAEFDALVMAMRAEDRKGRPDHSAGGPLSRYMYMIGTTDRVMAVDSP
jgi:hypothetical protein